MVCFLIAVEQEGTGRCFKGVGSQYYCKLGFCGTWEHTTRWCQLESSNAWRYHTYFIPERADLKDQISFSYGPSLDRCGYLSGRDESEDPGDFSDASEQDGTIICSGIGPGI